MFIEEPINERHKKIRKLVEGVGINDAPYLVKPRVNGKCVECPFFTVWRSMIRRCYSKIYHNKQPTYKDCKVHDDWLNFMAFKSWMEKQDWKGNNLDKDILKPGNKTYSKETCLFVSKGVNNLLNDHKAKRGEFPIGVCKFGNKYMAQCSGRKNRYIGLYDTPEQAHRAWAIEKVKIIRQVAETEQPEIKNALLLFANTI